MRYDEGEFMEANELPSEKPNKSLEDRLASVMEGEDVSISGLFDRPVFGGEGIYLVPEPNIIHLNRPRRKRRRLAARGPATVLIEPPQAASVIAIDLSEQANGGFKISPIHIRYGAHERSPFVVSLRGMSLSNDAAHEDERVPQFEAAMFDVNPESVPSISTLGAMAGDLYLQTERLEAREQFTDRRTARRPAFFRWMHGLEAGYFRLARTITSVFRPKRVSPYILEIEDDTVTPPRVVSLDLDIDQGFHEEDPIIPPAHVPVRTPTFHIIRSLATLSLLILIAMLPANVIRLVRDLRARQAAVAASSEEAIGKLSGLKMGGDLRNSIEALRAASGEFRNADKILSETNALAIGLSKLLPSTHASYKTARALMEIGEKSTNAAQLLAKGLDEALMADAGVLARLASVRAYAQGALPLLEDAATAYASVDANVVPEKEREKVKELGAFVEDARGVLRDFISMSDLITTVLGKDGRRRYLLIFQNSSELRATGGFMGSFAELDVDRGEISRLEVPGGGTYDLQGQLIAQVIPPKPLQLIASRWEFQDSNWSPDFPTAARKIRWFWSKSGGYTVDGVIAVNSDIVEKILTLTGPIEVPELGKTISAENFMIETQKAVELEYDKSENKPKKILSLLAPRLLERIKEFEPEHLLKVASLISESMENKDIQIALSNEAEDTKAQSFGWSGRLKESKGDVLAVIGSNIAGQKTDAVIKEQVRHEVHISKDGRISDQVTLTRTHQGKKGDLFSGVRNVEYFRFYVPRGSTLVSASGFDVIPSSLFNELREDAVQDPDLASTEHAATETSFNVSVWDEGDRTVFGGWTMLDPGSKESLSLMYRLPFSVSDLRDRFSEHGASASDGRVAYELLLTSQSGKPDRELEVSIQAPEAWDAHWIRSAKSVEGAWNRDRVVSALYETPLKKP